MSTKEETYLLSQSISSQRENNEEFEELCGSAAKRTDKVTKQRHVRKRLQSLLDRRIRKTVSLRPEGCEITHQMQCLHQIRKKF